MRVKHLPLTDILHCFVGRRISLKWIPSEFIWWSSIHDIMSYSCKQKGRILMDLVVINLQLWMGFHLSYHATERRRRHPCINEQWAMHQMEYSLLIFSPPEQIWSNVLFLLLDAWASEIQKMEMYSFAANSFINFYYIESFDKACWDMDDKNSDIFPLLIMHWLKALPEFVTVLTTTLFKIVHLDITFELARSIQNLKSCPRSRRGRAWWQHLNTLLWPSWSHQTSYWNDIHHRVVFETEGCVIDCPYIWKSRGGEIP